MVATAIPDIEGNLRAAMLGSALGRKFDHDPQRLADHIGVRVRRVPSTDITHWNSEDTLVLLYNGSNWLELARSNNGA